MKRFVASVALLASLASVTTGCTAAGALAGGAAASHAHHSDEDMTTGEGVVIGALVGLAVDAAILYTMTPHFDCNYPLCGSDQAGLR